MFTVVHQYISAKELRLNLKQVVEKVNKGVEFTVIYRSEPTMRIVPFKKGIEKDAKKLRMVAFDNAIGLGTAKDVKKNEDKSKVLTQRLREKYGVK